MCLLVLLFQRWKCICQRQRTVVQPKLGVINRDHCSPSGSNDFPPLLTLHFLLFHMYITGMGNKLKSERFQAATLHLCTGWVKAVWSAAGHSAALSFLPAVIESQSALMAAMAAQSTVLWRSWISEQSPRETGWCWGKSWRGYCLEEPLLCRSSFPTAQSCSKRQPFVTARSHSFREIEEMIWCLFLFVFWNWSN